MLTLKHAGSGLESIQDFDFSEVKTFGEFVRIIIDTDIARINSMRALIYSGALDFLPGSRGEKEGKFLAIQKEKTRDKNRKNKRLGPIDEWVDLYTCPGIHSIEELASEKLFTGLFISKHMLDLVAETQYGLSTALQNPRESYDPPIHINAYVQKCETMKTQKNFWFQKLILEDKNEFCQAIYFHGYSQKTSKPRDLTNCIIKCNITKCDEESMVIADILPIDLKLFYSITFPQKTKAKQKELIKKIKDICDDNPGMIPIHMSCENGMGEILGYVNPDIMTKSKITKLGVELIIKES